MAATGVYGKPVWNILQAGNKFHWLLVKAQRLKQVPGRKTDQKDREWIADLLQPGNAEGELPTAAADSALARPDPHPSQNPADDGGLRQSHAKALGRRQP